MSSHRRQEASRRNGALSRGPKTEAGKRRSSQNALRHGLLAKRVVLDTDKEENFHMLFNQYVDKFEPADGVEYGMIEEMVGCYWRYHRATAIENQLFNEAIDKHDGTDLERLAAAWRDLADSEELQNLLRYQSMMHRMHRRAMNSFFEVSDIGPVDEDLPNEPSPNSGHLETEAPEPPKVEDPHPSAKPAPHSHPDPNPVSAEPVPPHRKPPS